MEEKLVSIIMSCYNAESTVARAIDSILQQTYTNWELIIVNDCSTDKSQEVIESYDNSKIYLINHKENKGAGLARRTGIENSHGDYTTFLDSDDTLEPDALEVLVSAAIKYNADIVTPGMNIILSDKIIPHIPQAQIVKGVQKFSVDKSETYRFLNPQLVASKLWEKVTYSGRRFIEDSPTLIKLLNEADTRVFIDKITYNYFQYPNSLIHTSNKIKTLIFTILCGVDTADIIQYNHGDVGVRQLMAKVFMELSQLFMLQKTDEYMDEKQEIIEFIKNNIDKL